MGDISDGFHPEGAKELSPGINLSDDEQIASVDGERLVRTREKTGRHSVNLKSAFGMLYSVPLLGMALFVFSIGFPPFDDATTLDLTTHMIQHIVIVMAGVMIAYPLHRKGYFRRIEGKNSAFVGLAVIIVIITFWHLPANWDAAVLNPLIHAVEHSSFLLVGIIIGSTLQTLSDRAKIDVLLLGFFGHFGYGLVLISNYRIYPLYLLADQGVLGLVMFSVGPFYWTGILYLIFRNRAWFREVPSFGDKPFETPGPPIHRSDRSTGSSRRGGLRLVTPISTIVLVALLVGFYSYSVVAISFMPPSQQIQPSSSVHVLIVETPVSWNYYPENVTVVMGVNNTVTWVSHSLAYDTVTGVNGTLASGSIAPGQTFTYTFTSPGTYPYRCIYHPWMVGTVRVLAGTG
jgi:plastocyanin